MSDESIQRNRTLLVVAGIIAVVAVASIAYFAGMRGGENAPPVGPVAGPGQARLVKLPPRKFDSWVLGCVRNPRNITRCALVLQAVDSTQKRLLLRLSAMKTPRGPVIVVLTPPNALLPQGFTLTPDKGKPISVPYSRCMPRACQAIIALSEPVMSAMNTSAAATVHFVAGNGRPISYKIPTTGFSAGFAALKVDDTSKFAAANVPAATPAATPEAAPSPAAGSPASIDASQGSQTPSTPNQN